MISYRIGKLSQQIKIQLSHLIKYTLKDPRIKKNITIHSVKISKDLKLADIYWTLFCDTKLKDVYENLLHLSSGYLRYKLSQTIKTHQVPILKFHFYESINNI